MAQSPSAEPPPAVPPGGVAPKPQTPKQSGLERQRTSVRRQLGNLDEAGWFFRPWPRAGAPSPQQPVVPPSSNQ